MLQLKILLIFISLLTIPAYFLLKDNKIGITNFTNITKKDNNKASQVQEKEIRIEEKDLKNYLEEGSKVLSEVSIDFKDGKISISGITKKPKANFTAETNPKVENGHFLINIETLKLQGIEAPKYLKNQIEKAVSQAVHKNIGSAKNFKSVIIKEDYLVLIVK